MPVGVHINNYIHAFKIKGLPNAAFVSILRTAIVQLLL
jgi:hypothetical protein